MRTLPLLKIAGATSALCLVAACQAQPSAPVQSTSVNKSAAPAATAKDSIVQATLMADTTAVQPGTTFTLGVLYKIQPEWHIYYKSPGASGFATTVQWGLPPGASVSETLYPAPIRFQSPGPVVSYGYDGEVMLMVEAQAAGLPENGQVQVTAKSRWLMCSDRCIPNSKELTLSLPVGPGKPANQEIFKKYRQMLPKAVGELPSEVKLTSTSSGSTTNYEMTITPPAGTKLVADGHNGVFPANFFPVDQTGYVIDPPTIDGKVESSGSIKTYDGPVKFTWKAEPGKNSAEPLRRLEGTLVYQPVSGTSPAEPVLLELNQKM